MDLRERLQALADLVPVLEDPSADFGHWEKIPSTGGVIHMPWFEFGTPANAFTSAVSRGEWMVMGFDWGNWLQTDEGRSLRDQREAVARATPEQLEKLLTAIIRSDRFSEGSIEGAYESGLLLAIAQRAAALRDAT